MLGTSDCHWDCHSFKERFDLFYLIFFGRSKQNRNDKTMAWVLSTRNPGTGEEWWVDDWRARPHWRGQLAIAGVLRRDVIFSMDLASVHKSFLSWNADTLRSRMCCDISHDWIIRAVWFFFLDNLIGDVFVFLTACMHCPYKQETRKVSQINVAHNRGFLSETCMRR